MSFCPVSGLLPSYGYRAPRKTVHVSADFGDYISIEGDRNQWKKMLGIFDSNNFQERKRTQLLSNRIKCNKCNNLFIDPGQVKKASSGAEDMAQ